MKRKWNIIIVLAILTCALALLYVSTAKPPADAVPAASPTPTPAAEPAAESEPVPAPSLPVPAVEPSPAPAADLSPTPVPAAVRSPLIGIVQQPMRTTVLPGGSASFSARARNAESAAWFLISPDGAERLRWDDETLRKRFPPLLCSGGDGDTLLLSRIPSDLNGWQAACLYTDAQGTVRMTDAAKLTVDDGSAAELAAAQRAAVTDRVNAVLDKPVISCFARRSSGMFVQRGIRYTIGVPENFAEGPMDLVIFFNPEKTPFQGEKDYSLDSPNHLIYAEDIIDTVMDANADTLVVVSSLFLRSKDLTEMLRVIEAIGVPSFRRVVCSGWSAGGNGALYCAAAILNEHPSMPVPLIVFNDCNHTENVKYKVFDTLADHGVRFLVFSSKDHAVRDHRLMRITEKALPIAVIRTLFLFDGDSNAHIERRSLAFADNLFGYALGHIDELPGAVYDAQYSYGRYDYERKDTVWCTAEEAYALLSGEDAAG